VANNHGPCFAGLDWASRTHALCVIDQAGQIRARFEIPNTGKSFTGLMRRLSKLAVAEVAIERSDGPLVEALLDAGLRVVVITPRQVEGLRSRYSGSGAKSDASDAYLLADVLRTDGHRFTPLTQDSDATQVLRALSRTRKQLVEARVGLVNQLAALLERVFPGAIGLFARLDSDVAIAFLTRYPTEHAADRLTQARFAAFLRRISYRGRKPVSELFARIHDAPPAGLSPTEAEDHAVCVLTLLRAITTTRGQERELEAEIIERLEAHADAHIFTSLPKAGHGVRAAALLAEIGDVRSRFPDEESLAALAGVAPVTRASGKLHTVGFRWAADKKTPQRPHRLHRRLPPRQPLGRPDLQPGHRPRQTPPTRRAHPRPRLDPRDLALLARPHRLQPHPTRRRPTTPHSLNPILGLT
jgi:transposase